MADTSPARAITSSASGKQRGTNGSKVQEKAMSNKLAFDDVLDVEAQAELVAIMMRRLAERGRERVAATVAEARQEFAAGQCQPMTAARVGSLPDGKQS